MRHWIIACSIYFTVTLQCGVVGEVAVIYRPFLPAITLIAISHLSHATSAIVWSACLGLMIDGLAPERLGVQMVLSTIIAAFLQAIRGATRSRSTLTMMLTCLVVAFCWRVVSPFIYANLCDHTVSAEGALVAAAREAVATCCFGGAVVLCGRIVLGGLPLPRSTVVGFDNRWGMLTD